MSKTIEFFFDVGSPTSYLAWTQLPKIAARNGAALRFRPMLLGGVFKATGNASPAAIPAKAQYMNADMARFAKRYGVRLGGNRHFPVNTLAIMRMATAAEAEGRLEPFLAAIYPAMWVDGENLGEEAVLRGVLGRAGLDADALFAAAARDDVKARLKETTEEAVSRGVFGAPTCFVGTEMFFGQDRLDFIEEALKGEAGPQIRRL
ncbi:MAG: 2-hydroxychromene-2-carboxylate isomerase [Alphaproteobacteria bacterium]|nr:2-hydroxychromene-2-carboxylate isomerase [Alphaproteobacteria bacterium]